MPNQRQPNKRNVGGYMDETIKAAIKGAQTDETQFVEFCVLRGLLIQKLISKAEVRELTKAGRINPRTCDQLQRERLI